jgi:hypothetical protein
VTYPDALYRTITDIVARNLSRVTDVGTVASTQSATMRAMVIFDGATVATPVKVAGAVHCRAGDRVGLTKYASDWYVTIVTNRIAGPNAAGVNLSVPTGNTTTTTVANLPGDPSFTFTKRWDSSPLLMCGGTTAFTTATASMGFYLGLTVLGVQTTYLMSELESGPGVRFGATTVRILPDAVSPAVVPAGEYTVNLMWARTTGGGTVGTNSPDDHAPAYLLELGA